VDFIFGFFGPVSPDLAIVGKVRRFTFLSTKIRRSFENLSGERMAENIKTLTAGFSKKQII